MKVHNSPALLALTALLSVYTVTADIISSGVYYDAGKAAYSDHPTITGKGATSDSSLCWAITGSNMIQYWQDTYHRYSDNETATPTGLTNENYATPSGTRYLNVYEHALSNAQSNEGGDISSFIEWWHTGSAPKTGNNTLISQSTGFYNNMYAQNTPSYTKTTETNDMATFIISNSFVKGTSIGLDIQGKCNHAITCWGYETDDNGNLTALILTDGDDGYFGAFRVEVQKESVWQKQYIDYGTGTVYAPEYTEGERLVLLTDEQRNTENHYYGNGYSYIVGATAINTPNSYTDADGNSTDLSAVRFYNTVNSAIEAGSVLTENTTLRENAIVNGAGITVGDGENVIILTSASGSALSLTSDGSTSSTGLTVANGSMVSLKDLTVDGYEAGGVNLVSKAYFNDGNVSVTNNNISGNGAGITNTSYLEIKDGANVAITGNTASENGGGIYNKENAIVSIRGNDSVTFSGNQASRGNDIYNQSGGSVNIADNAAVTFHGNGNNAIVNKGDLYLSAKTGDSIDFYNATLDSSEGTTYIGRDINGRSTDTGGSINFHETSDGKGAVTTITSSTETGYSRYTDSGEFIVYAIPDIQEPTINSAEFNNLVMSFDEIAGTSKTESSISFADIQTSASLTLRDLTMPDNSSITALSEQTITLSNLTILFTENHLSGNEQDGYTLNLADMLVGNFLFDGVIFDLTNLSTLSGDVKIDLSGAYLEGYGPFISYNQEPITGMQLITATSPFSIPEPTTTTLGITALIALALRRRRK